MLTAAFLWCLARTGKHTQFGYLLPMALDVLIVFLIVCAFVGGP
jgi:hypothetical protein